MRSSSDSEAEDWKPPLPARLRPLDKLALWMICMTALDVLDYKLSVCIVNCCVNGLQSVLPILLNIKMLNYN